LEKKEKGTGVKKKLQSVGADMAKRRENFKDNWEEEFGRFPLFATVHKGGVGGGGTVAGLKYYVSRERKNSQRDNMREKKTLRGREKGPYRKKGPAG